MGFTKQLRGGHRSFWKISHGEHGWGKMAIWKDQLGIWRIGMNDLEPWFLPFSYHNLSGVADCISVPWERFIPPNSIVQLLETLPCGRIIHPYPVELRSGQVICSNQLTNKMWAERDIYHFQSVLLRVIMGFYLLFFPFAVKPEFAK